MKAPTSAPRYRRSLVRSGHGALARVVCDDCHRDWSRTMTREEFSDYPRREQALDRWVGLIAAEHDPQHEEAAA